MIVTVQYVTVTPSHHENKWLTKGQLAEAPALPPRHAD